MWSYYFFTYSTSTLLYSSKLHYFHIICSLITYSYNITKKFSIYIHIFFFIFRRVGTITYVPFLRCKNLHITYVGINVCNSLRVTLRLS